MSRRKTTTTTMVGAAVAMLLLVAHTAAADESGSFFMLRSYQSSYVTIEHSDATYTGGILRGTQTILDSSGGPFADGMHSTSECLVFSRSSDGGIGLHARQFGNRGLLAVAAAEPAGGSCAAVPESTPASPGSAATRRSTWPAIRW